MIESHCSDVQDDQSCSATMMSEVTISTTTGSCERTVHSTISQNTARHRVQLDGFDILCLGSYEESSRLSDKNELRAFGKMLKKSLAWREVMCMEHMALSMNGTHARNSHNNAKWLAIIPEGNIDLDSFSFDNCSNEERGKTVEKNNTDDRSSVIDDSLEKKLSELLIRKDFKGSISLLQSIVTFLKRKFSSLHHSVTTPLIQNIGNIYLRWGKFDKALQAFHEARKGWIAQGKDYLMSLVLCIHKEGLCLFGMGELVYALEKFRNALDLIEASDLKSKNPITKSKILNNIAVVMFKMNHEKNMEKACELFVQAMSCNTIPYVKVGYDLSIIALRFDKSNFLTNYAFVLLSTSFYSKACGALKCALKVQSNILGVSHIKSLTTMENLAFASANLDNPDLSVYEALLELYQQKYGDMHTRTALVIGKIALAYIEIKAYDKAVKYLRKQLDCQRINLGSDHPDVMNTVYAITRLEIFAEEVTFKHLLQSQVQSNAFTQLTEII